MVHSTDPSMTCRYLIPNVIITIIHSNMPPKAFSQSLTALKILFRFPARSKYEHIKTRRGGTRSIPIGIRIIVGPLIIGSVEKKERI